MHTLVDLANWPRRSTFDFFKNYDDPFFNITAPVEVTGLYRLSKQEGSSFFLNSLFCVMQAANALEAFRLRLLDGQLVCYDTVHIGSTVLMPDNTFRFCYFDYTPDRQAFLDAGQQRIDQLMASPELDPKDDALNMLHISVIPWVAFTSFKHARRWGVADTVPKIVMGKYERQGDKLLIPLSVEVHHAMMDGFHVGEYFRKVEELFKG
ncbi:MAG: chloramphenicol acetyltransferase [Bacteroidetes bacterium]|nr:MAG: chloramphenicol acetyltransferase [Bacteroidota bacterium]